MAAPWELKDSEPPSSGQGHSTINLYNSMYTVDGLRTSMVMHSVIIPSLK